MSSSNSRTLMKELMDTIQKLETAHNCEVDNLTRENENLKGEIVRLKAQIQSSTPGAAINFRHASEVSLSLSSEEATQPISSPPSSPEFATCWSLTSTQATKISQSMKSFHTMKDSQTVNSSQTLKSSQSLQSSHGLSNRLTGPNIDLPRPVFNLKRKAITSTPERKDNVDEDDKENEEDLTSLPPVKYRRSKINWDEQARQPSWSDLELKSDE
ncbi:hypothetical protein H4I95_05681 [Botrytis cinerea]